MKNLPIGISTLPPAIAALLKPACKSTACWQKRIWTRCMTPSNASSPASPTKGYADKYRDGRELYLVGIEFSKPARNIADFTWEKV